jgi:isoquinoline 1-oxidoreductase subunit beta
MKNPVLDRRQFVVVSAGVGAGLVLGLRALDAMVGDPKPGWADAADGPWEPSIYVRIDPSGVITVPSFKSEMGQGVWTSLPMIVAEELDADWSKLVIERAPTNKGFNSGTGGSQSVTSMYQPLRVAGATARAMLVAAAAQRWGVAATECTTANSVVTHPPSRRTATYGELTAAASQLAVPAASEVKLKDPAAFTFIGKSLPRRDVAIKVDGSAQFGIDVRVPNMLVASVERCPAFGGSLKSLDDSKARAMPGVRQVLSLEAMTTPAQLPARVVVLADDTWSAMAGRRALKVEWDAGPNAAYDSTTAWAEYHARTNDTAQVVQTVGATRDPQPGEKLVEATYEFPLLAHAPMEPMNCTADVRADSAELWAPSQSPDRLGTSVAQFLGLPGTAVNVHCTFLGGGFGRRSNADFGVEAAQISKAAGRPVKVVWTREEDIQHDFYRFEGLQRMRAVIDAQGGIISWECRGVGNTRPPHPPYNIPNMKLDAVTIRGPVPMGPWRSVANSADGWCVEAFMDEIAEAAKKDPIALRIALLDGKPRAQEVLRLAGEKSGWGKPLPPRTGRGVSFYAYGGLTGTLIAMVVEAEVPASGDVKVKRVTCAVDCGQLINPDTVVTQVEGSVGWALSAALWGEITIKEGRVMQGNFNTYPVARMSDMPEVDVHLVENHERPTGVGEPAVPPFAPALASAVFAATGIRVRRTPMKPEILRGRAAT